MVDTVGCAQHTYSHPTCAKERKPRRPTGASVRVSVLVCCVWCGVEKMSPGRCEQMVPGSVWVRSLIKGEHRQPIDFDIGHDRTADAQAHRISDDAALPPPSDDETRLEPAAASEAKPSGSSSPDDHPVMVSDDGVRASTSPEQETAVLPPPSDSSYNVSAGGKANASESPRAPATTDHPLLHDGHAMAPSTASPSSAATKGAPPRDEANASEVSLAPTTANHPLLNDNHAMAPREASAKSSSSAASTDAPPPRAETSLAPAPSLAPWEETVPPKMSPMELEQWAALYADGKNATAAGRRPLKGDALDVYNPIRPRRRHEVVPSRYCLTCLEQTGRYVAVPGKGHGSPHKCVFVDPRADLIDVNAPDTPQYLRQPPLHRGRRPGHLTSSRHTPTVAETPRSDSTPRGVSSRRGSQRQQMHRDEAAAPVPSTPRWLVSAKPWLSRYAPSAAPIGANED